MEEILHALSYLFYAVAHADRKVEKAEKEKIHTIVDEHWQLLVQTGDPFAVNAVGLIDRMIEELEKDDYETELALTQFKNVYVAHPEHFTPEMKEFIFEVCARTANTFNQMNKSELVILSRIEGILND